MSRDSMDFTQARINMIEQQIRPWEVLDRRVLDIMDAIPRHEYVPGKWRDLAYADMAIPLDNGGAMLPPRIEARILQALQLAQEDKVLEIGTGTGYLSALLAGLSGHVISVDLDPAVCGQARACLAGHGVGNVTVVEGDGLHGWEPDAPYDAIAVTGSVPVLDDAFKCQLKAGGRLFVIVGTDPVMAACLFTRTGEQDWMCESLFETVVPGLQGAVEPEMFEL